MYRYLPYSIPVITTLLYVAACYENLYWTGLLFFPLLSLLHSVLGKFQQQEIIDEYLFFHHNKGMEIFKAFSGIFFVFFNIWVAVFLLHHQLTAVQLIFFIYTLIIINSNFAIALAHDLMHAPHAVNRFLGSVLLLNNGFFYLETDHIYIHHRYVGTDNDPASANAGQALYPYLYQSISGRVKMLFGLKKIFNPGQKNTIVQANIIRLGICIVGLIVAHLLSLQYAICLLAQFMLVTLLYEVITYIQHYGLRRVVHSSNIAEEVNLAHSWNCYYRLSAYMHYMMPVHSIHHLKNEPDLRQLTCAGPEFPRPFAQMAILAFFPVVWKKIMYRPLENIKTYNG